MNGTGRLTGKVAVITGAASGIGRATALRFAEEGARAVVVADLREDPREGGTPTHELIREQGGDAVFVRTDVTSPRDLTAVVAAAAPYGGLDVLVNNAGLLRAARVTDMTEADYDAVMDVNAKSVFFACQAAARVLVAEGRPGVLLNLSSVGGLRGMKGIAAYCGAKGAVRLMTYALAQELGPRGIRVCALHPGVVDTAMTRVDVPVGDVAAGIPLRRVGRPEDIADAAAFLASDAASFISGASLTVDGAELAIG